MDDWTAEKEEELCELWAEATYMYNKRDLNYKNNAKRLHTRRRWAAKLDVTGKCMLSQQMHEVTFILLEYF